MTGYTPIYNLPYVEPSDLVASYPTVSEELAENVETAIAGSGGLSLIFPTSIANSGGSASSSNGTITVTGVSSISLNGIFSATYENYALAYRLTCSTAGQALNARMRASGTDATGSDYNNEFLAAYGATTLASRTSSQTTARIGAVTTNISSNLANIFGPYKTEVTQIGGYSLYSAGSSLELSLEHFTHALANAYDGLTIYPNSGTITGTLRIYGYKGA